MDSTMSTYFRNVSFNGDTIRTTVTIDPDTVSAWISDTRSSIKQNHYSPIVGLDVEWLSSYYTRGQQNPVATVQICVERRCLIFQIINSVSTPQSLADFLSDKEFTFVGVGVKSDLDKLHNNYGIGSNTRTMDLRDMAAVLLVSETDLRLAGMKQLARIVLGIEMEKPKWVTMSRWDGRYLTEEQVEYACIDAFVSFQIGRVLIERVVI